jgi:Domain of unknown function (DUF4389)
MPAYPVTFEADYVEKRSRLTTFFRLILAIPHLIVLTFYAIAAWVVVIVAWFALLFTGRWPQGMYDFVGGFMRYSTAVYGYVNLLTDAYPPFGPDTDDYPVRLNISPPKEEYTRLKVLFRIILMIPPYIIAYAMSIVAGVGSFLAWFAIVVLGRQPKGLQDMTVLGLSYQQRAYTYFMLITEDWPPFTDDSTARVEGPPFGALPSSPPAAGVADRSEEPTAAGAPAEAPAAPPATPPPSATPDPGATTSPEPPPSAPPPPHGDPLGEEPPPPGEGGDGEEPRGPSPGNP